MKADFLRYHAPVWVCLLLTVVLLALPTGYEDNIVFQESDIQPALVLSTDESTVIDTGLVRSGEQRCQLEVLGGQFKGQTVEGKNTLNGSLEPVSYTHLDVYKRQGSGRVLSQDTSRPRGGRPSNL